MKKETSSIEKKLGEQCFHYDTPEPFKSITIAVTTDTNEKVPEESRFKPKAIELISV